MKTKTFILASIALFALGVGSAMSGPCTVEIDGLAKTLASKDAGSGPTVGPSGATQSAGSPSGQHPPSAIMGQGVRARPRLPKMSVVKPRASRPPRSKGRPVRPRGVAIRIEASSTLRACPNLDRQGKEAECMEAVREAKQLAGPR